MWNNGKALLINVWEVLSPVSTPDPLEDTHIHSNYANSKGQSWIQFLLWCPCLCFMINQDLLSVQAHCFCCVSLAEWSCLRSYCGSEMELTSQTIALCYYSFSIWVACWLFTQQLLFTAQKNELTVPGITKLLIKKGLKALFSSASHPISSKYRQHCLGLCSRRYAVA